MGPFGPRSSRVPPPSLPSSFPSFCPLAANLSSTPSPAFPFQPPRPPRPSTPVVTARSRTVSTGRARTTATGTTEDVTPWELYPAPDEDVPSRPRAPSTTPATTPSAARSSGGNSVSLLLEYFNLRPTIAAYMLFFHYTLCFSMSFLTEFFCPYSQDLQARPGAPSLEALFEGIDLLEAGLPSRLTIWGIPTRNPGPTIHLHQMQRRAQLPCILLLMPSQILPLLSINQAFPYTILLLDPPPANPVFQIEKTNSLLLIGQSLRSSSGPSAR